MPCLPSSSRLRPGGFPWIRVYLSRVPGSPGSPGPLLVPTSSPSPRLRWDWAPWLGWARPGLSIHQPSIRWVPLVRPALETRGERGKSGSEKGCPMIKAPPGPAGSAEPAGPRSWRGRRRQARQETVRRMDQVIAGTASRKSDTARRESIPSPVSPYPSRSRSF